VNGREPARLVVAFARSLRRAGLDAPLDATIAFGEALALVGVGAGGPTYWAGRAVFVHRPEEIAVYDRVFGAFFGGIAGGASGAPRLEQIVALDADDAGSTDGTGDRHDADDVQAVRFSRVEVLRTRDFAAYTAAEHDEARRLMAALATSAAPRESRRRVPARRARRHPDLRATVRSSIRTDGELIRRRYRRRATRPRRLVLLLDVSGSMEAYARALVRFVHAAVIGAARVEAFALGTRLTRLTREFATHDPDAAVAAAARRVVDWSGGTRLGETLHTFNEQWGARGLARGAVVVILSDGWDRGDPDVLHSEMQRLSRVAHRVIWVNPLKASPGYVPIAQGMAAALPFVDEFVEGHSLDALQRVAAAIAREDR
jgi:hypothetical protein